MAKYQASKILAHKATLDWVAAHQPLPFQVITMHPVCVAGPDMTRTVKEQPLAFINDIILRSLDQGVVCIPPVFVDVRDVSRAHVAALKLPRQDSEEKEKGRGVVKEFLLAGRPTSWAAISRFVKEKEYGVLSRMSTDEETYPEPPVTETERAERELGIEWMPVEVTLGDVCREKRALERAS